MKRRELLQLLAATPVLATAVPAPAGDTVHLTVYKSPTCGCCAKWVDYLRERGFGVDVVDVADLGPVKQRHGVPPRLASCHTALVDGYVVEGHVPADDIRRLLAERPPLLGISAPGMPQQSPGMNSVEPRDYDVIGFAADGRLELYARY